MKLTGQIIGAAMEVHTVLGPGFLESVYHGALVRELCLRGLSLETQRQIDIRYKDKIVGRHRLDMIIEKSVVVELKAVHGIVDVHKAQALSYLKATGLEVALILNFGEPSLAWRRLVRSRHLREIEI